MSRLPPTVLLCILMAVHAGCSKEKNESRAQDEHLTDQQKTEIAAQVLRGERPQSDLQKYGIVVGEGKTMTAEEFERQLAAERGAASRVDATASTATQPSHEVRRHNKAFDEDFTITPFDPKAGIWFKYGRVYLDRERQIAAFQQAAGYNLPQDFLEMIGQWCEGGFNGHYRVYIDERIEVQWHHLLVMKLADQIDWASYDTLKLIQSDPKLFGTPGNLKFFPFGEASIFQPPGGITNGYLAFDVQRKNAVVFISRTDGKQIEIAGSFRAMMLHSSFVFYG